MPRQRNRKTKTSKRKTKGSIKSHSSRRAAPSYQAETAPAERPAGASEWILRVQRLREEKRAGEGFRRTVGTYQVYHDDLAVAGLSGMTVERQGPGNNGQTGRREHRCIAAGSYPLNSHATEKYRTTGYRASGTHPRPAIELGNAEERVGILLHPADGYASTIGCINLSGALADANSNIELSDSMRRVIDVINDLKRFEGGLLPTRDGEPIPNCYLDVRDPEPARTIVGRPARRERRATTTAAEAEVVFPAAPAPEVLADAAIARAADVIDCDVVIQAGHEDTPDDATGGEGPLGNEIDWTPIVANEAVRVLRAAGVDAIKETAHIKVTRQRYRCKLALFIHFDDPDAGESGPSVGYSHSSDAPAAEEWKNLYKEFFPFNDTWNRDNFTRDEEFYYGFKYTVTSDGEFVIELGDLGSFRQAQWLKPRLTWLGNLIAHYVSKRIGEGGVPRPAPFVAPVPGPQPLGRTRAAPLAAPATFTTKPSISGNERGTSKTKGLNGTEQSLPDGTIVIEATEALAATRTDGLDGTLTAFQRRVEKEGAVTVEQKNYSYRQRKLPDALLLRQTGGFPADVPAGFTATAVRSVVASQFGKNDTQDEGTGSPLMGLIQTNSEVFGASIKKSAMVRAFGPNWSTSEKRLRALLEVFFPSKRRLVRVPLVDVGPGETIRAEVDLTWSCDQFLGTDGQADVVYRALIPI